MSRWRRPRPRSRAASAAGLALLASGIATAGCGPSQSFLTARAIERAAPALEQAGVDAEREGRRAATALAVGTASSRLVGVFATVDPLDPLFLRTAFLTADAAGNDADMAALLRAWQPPEDDLDARLAHLRHDLRSGRWGEARARAWDSAERATDDERPAFLALWYDTFRQDPEFLPPVHTITADSGEHTRWTELGGGSTITFKAKRGDDTVGAVKPAQSRLQSNWRAEIAAWRLCALIHCDFSVPINREIRVSEKDFLRLWGIPSLASRKGYASNFGDLVWFTDDAGDKWLHATLKEWVPGFTQFPIEHADVWRPWLSLQTSPERLRNASVEDIVRGFRGRQPATVGGILQRAGDLSGFELAHQISDLHVFDYLTNNWDRYSGIYFGVNCQFNHGRFVSIDNGAAFQTPDMNTATATLQRLRQVQVFSRRTIEAIRWMDPEAVRTLLFPPLDYGPNLQEDRRFEAFLARRQKLLEYVDGLIARHGEDRVLLFD